MPASIELAKTDITSMPVDAIVNAANEALQLGSGVAGAIRQRGGPDDPGGVRPDRDLRRGPGRRDQGRASSTPAGSSTRSGRSGRAATTARRCCSPPRCSQALRARRGHRRAPRSRCPRISTGVFGFPLQRAAEITVAAARSFVPTAEYVQRIVFCLFDDAALRGVPEGARRSGPRVPGLACSSRCSCLAAGAAPLSPGQLQALQSDRNVGLAALEEGNLAEAARRFERVRQARAVGPARLGERRRRRDAGEGPRRGGEASRARRCGSRPRTRGSLALDGVRRELAGDRRGADGRLRQGRGRGSPKDLAVALGAGAAGEQPRSGGPAGAAAETRGGARAGAHQPLSSRAPAPSSPGEPTTRRRRPRRADRLTRLSAETPGSSGRSPRRRRPLARATRRRPTSSTGSSRTSCARRRATSRRAATSSRGVVGLPLEDWSPALAAAMRARAGRPVPVTFAPVAGGGARGLSRIGRGRPRRGQAGPRPASSRARRACASRRRRGRRIASGEPIPGSAGDRSRQSPT